MPHLDLARRLRRRPDQSVENPLGVGGEPLHEWVFRPAAWRDVHGKRAASDDEHRRRLRGARLREHRRRGSWAATCSARSRRPWRGRRLERLVGRDPPYHVPVFVLTHHPREPLEMEGGTTFHFVTDGIEAALERAKDAAGGKDVRSAAAPRAQYLRGPARRDGDPRRPAVPRRRRAAVRRRRARGEAGADPRRSRRPASRTSSTRR